MARYTGPRTKVSRRSRQLLDENKAKYFDRRPYPPGDHGRGRIKETQYLIQLREKQKARRIYGVLEKQFRNYYKEAASKGGITGESLLQILESRLDNVMYRSNFATSRAQARQLVSHGHVLVDGRRVDKPSIRVRPGTNLELRERSKDLVAVQHAIDTEGDRGIPEWLEVDAGERKITVRDLPTRAQVDTQIQEQLIVELYSK